MKYLSQLLPLLVVFFLGQILIAQENITVSFKTISMSKGDQPAYVVDIPQADYEKIVKSWSKVIRQNTKSKVEETGQELIITGTSIKDIYNQPINIYSTIIKSDSSVKVLAAYEIDSAFFDFDKSNESIQYEKTHSHIQTFMRDFAVDEYQNAVETELQQEEKKMKRLSKELSDLMKDNENYNKDIKGNEQNITHNQDAISSLEHDRERKLAEINSKKETIAGINDPELLDQAKGQLKTLEKEKKSISNKLEKDQKNIVKYQSNIEELNHEIERNLEKQIIKKDEISAQETKVQAVQNKLSGIK